MDIHSLNNEDNLRHRPLIFLDLETTGLIVQKHEILEIGALKTEPKKPFKIQEELSIKVKPREIEKADKSSLKIVGYSASEWESAITLEEVLKILDSFSKDGVLVGYNTNFDWAVLDRAYYFFGRKDPFYYHRLDVMSMAYGKLFGAKSLKKFSLGEICKYLNIDRGVKHQALSDAKATYKVFKKLMEM